ncbi:MAG: hypothetical protein HC862_22100 [Scytonema sp. RU_4_4]|nr:hypothetical protein [Scytonema sp. RU_4_4]NJR72782.1 hypothetical protein [Scytonema sp. CRU_2_7]
MPVVDSQNQKTNYSCSTLERAERALVCSPFNPCLFETMRSRRVALSEMTAHLGVQNSYTNHPISELAADNALAWLIQVGVLRREVDGQGITDSFRLTPLGRQIVEQFQRKSWRTPTWSDNLYNAVIRWFRLPF